MSNERLTVLKGGMLRYRYDISADVGFDFNCLSEVGTNYQSWFKDEIAARGLKVETRELDQAPWVADFIVEGVIA